MEASRDSKGRVQFFASFGYYNNTRFRHKDLNYFHSALKYSKILKYNILIRASTEPPCKNFGFLAFRDPCNDPEKVQMFDTKGPDDILCVASKSPVRYAASNRGAHSASPAGLYNSIQSIYTDCC